MVPKKGVPSPGTGSCLGGLGAGLSGASQTDVCSRPRSPEPPQAQSVLQPEPGPVLAAPRGSTRPGLRNDESDIEAEGRPHTLT